MAVSYASNRVTVDGPYKNGTTTALSPSTKTLTITSGAVVAGDIGRLLAIIPDPADTAKTQVRMIVGVSGTTVTLHDDWVGGAVASGTIWRVAHNLQDIHDLSEPQLEKIGANSYRWDADWYLINFGFLGDTNKALEIEKTPPVRDSTAVASMCGCSAGCIVQFGVLVGGEDSSSIETREGCRIEFRKKEFWATLALPRSQQRRPRWSRYKFLQLSAARPNPRRKPDRPG